MINQTSDAWVVCLCAAWCNVCRSLRPDFEALAAQSAGVHLAWVDVEDEEALVGELEIETFPTILMGSSEELRFVGAIQPQTAVLTRLMAGLLGPDGVAVQDDEALAALRRVIASRS